VISIALGVFYAVVFRDLLSAHSEKAAPGGPRAPDPSPAYRAMLVRVSAIVFLTTAVSSIVFQSTTFALPKIFDERLRGFAAEIAAWLDRAAPGEAELATTVGALAFIVFAVASLAQVAVGSSLDRFGPRPVFMIVAAMQVVFFAAMPGLDGALAFAVALGFMLGAFGQIPINDFMIGKMASGPFRARIYAVRYVVSFTALAVTLPLIAVVYERWGFDVLFLILSASAAVILAAVACLPRRLPAPSAAVPAE
jgi:MFS family permease